MKILLLLSVITHALPLIFIVIEPVMVNMFMT